MASSKLTHALITLSISAIVSTPLVAQEAAVAEDVQTEFDPIPEDHVPTTAIVSACNGIERFSDGRVITESIGTNEVARIRMATSSIVRLFNQAGYARGLIPGELAPLFIKNGCNPEYVNTVGAQTQSSLDLLVGPADVTRIFSPDLATLESFVYSYEDIDLTSLIQYVDPFEPNLICSDVNVLQSNSQCDQLASVYDSYRQGNFTKQDYCAARLKVPNYDPTIANAYVIAAASVVIGIGHTWYTQYQETQSRIAVNEAIIERNNQEIKRNEQALANVNQNIDRFEESIRNRDGTERDVDGWLDRNHEDNIKKRDNLIKDTADRERQNADLKDENTDLEGDERESADEPSIEESVECDTAVSDAEFEQYIEQMTRAALLCRGGVVDSRILDDSLGSEGSSGKPDGALPTIDPGLIPDQADMEPAPDSSCNLVGLSADLEAINFELEREDIKVGMEEVAHEERRNQIMRYRQYSCPDCQGDTVCRERESSRDGLNVQPEMVCVSLETQSNFVGGLSSEVVEAMEASGVLDSDGTMTIDTGHGSMTYDGRVWVQVNPVRERFGLPPRPNP